MVRRHLEGERLVVITRFTHLPTDAETIAAVVPTRHSQRRLIAVLAAAAAIATSYVAADGGDASDTNHTHDTTEIAYFGSTWS